MNFERSFGLQWRLALICLAAGSAGAVIALAVFYLAGSHLGFGLVQALGLGFGAGLLVAIVGAVVGAFTARAFKLRLWEAGRMARRIAGGDYRARLDVGPDDEVGWLEEQLNIMAGQLERAVNSLKELAEQNRLLGEKAGRGAALEERMRLARDLHDTVNQQLFVLAMRSAAVKKKLERGEEEKSTLLAEMGDLEELARRAHSQIRELIMELRPVTLEKEGLAAALRDYCRATAEREGWDTEFLVDSSLQPEGKVAETIFRLAQEILNNVSKHASAEKVSITLDREGNMIRLIIKDDGVGFDPAVPLHPTAVGLAGMHERAAAAGGRVQIESAPGLGTAVSVFVPHCPEEGGC